MAAPGIPFLTVRFSRRKADLHPLPQRVYANVDVVSEAATVHDAAATALQAAAVLPCDVDLVELAADGALRLDHEEAVGLAAVYGRESSGHNYIMTTTI